MPWRSRTDSGFRLSSSVLVAAALALPLAVSGDEEFEEEDSEEEGKLEVRAEVGTERCGCHRGRRR